VQAALAATLLAAFLLKLLPVAGPLVLLSALVVQAAAQVSDLDMPAAEAGGAQAVLVVEEVVLAGPVHSLATAAAQVGRPPTRQA
jgi:hypothetical protein